MVDAILRFYAVSASSTEVRNVVVVKDWTEVSSTLLEEGVIKYFDVICVDLHLYEVEIEKKDIYFIYVWWYKFLSN